MTILQVDTPVVHDHEVEHLLLDSRKAFLPATSLFFALTSPRRDGHDFIGELYQKGVRSFVVSRYPDTGVFDDANFILVSDTLLALQQLAAHHRGRFSIPVIGITGSNGKTIVKEWLFQLLQPDHSIVRSPKSYNSQIGVPLSVWQMRPYHTLAIFEAGISEPGEMERLARIIRPTIGVLTNIGEAHSEGFASAAVKEQEKRRLFTGAVIPDRLTLVQQTPTSSGTRLVAHRAQDPATLLSIEIPFWDQAAIQNALTCWELLLHLQYDPLVIQQRMQKLTAVDMRMILKKGIHGCVLINDSYSADVVSLQIALDFLVQQAGPLSKTVILSDFLQHAESDTELYAQVIALLQKRGITRLIAIGERVGKAAATLLAGVANLPALRLETYLTTESFLRSAPASRFDHEAILIKGARPFALERIVAALEQKVHQTRLEIDLAALLHNLHQYQQRLRPSTRIMAMVKAFAYGSGAVQVAGLLQFHKVDYLGVAYADEGVELRKAGIMLPIMVMNTEPSAFEAMAEYRLEPVVYSLELLQQLDDFLQREAIVDYPVHIEFETGLNRLGIACAQTPLLIKKIASTTSFRIQSVFSHLAASEDPDQDSFTRSQFDRFMQAAIQVEAAFDHPILKHIANSAAALRLPSLQLDMVRLGIGLYGVETAPGLLLQPVASLRAAIAQIHSLEPGETISYNRRGILTRPSRIATVRLGYADGYPRSLGNGVGKVLIKGKLAPVTGTICMDMFMVDVTDIDGVSETDEVELFGKELPVQTVAGWAQTIPYAILCGIADRVKRVYFEQ